MAKIKAIDPQVKGMKLCVPVDGIISIDAEGIAVVSDKAAKILIEGTNDWKMADEGKDAGTDDKSVEKAKKTAEKAPATESKENEDAEADEVVEGIKKMNLEELVAMAEEAGYDKAEWEKFASKTGKTGIKLMSAYLIKKYNAEKTAE